MTSKVEAIFFATAAIVLIVIALSSSSSSSSSSPLPLPSIRTVSVASASSVTTSTDTDTETTSTSTTIHDDDRTTTTTTTTTKILDGGGGGGGGDGNDYYDDNHHRRKLPEKVLIGYAHTCDNNQVPTAVKDGVNVVIWDFWAPSPPSTKRTNEDSESSESFSSANPLDFECIENLIHKLDSEGYDDTVHLLSMGGWNGGHLNEYFKTPKDWFDAWKAMVGHIFHGIDVDFEGNDDMKSPMNYLPMDDQMIKMGEIMKLAQADGYIISIVPAQSYLDPSSKTFSRYFNTTDRTRTDYHPEFSYFGQNAYAYWLAVYGDYIDLIIVQFYESYSRASMEIIQNGQTPEGYLQKYVWDINDQSQSFYVDFALDPDVKLKSQYVKLPVTKLVWGFGNGWTKDDNDRNIYFPPECIQAAYQGLWDWMIQPRGLMFWSIGQEGKNGVYYAKEFNDILHIRTTTTTADRNSSSNNNGKYIPSSSAEKVTTTTAIEEY